MPGGGRGGHHQTGNSEFGGGMTTMRRDDLTVIEIRKALAFRDAHGGGWMAAARVVGCSEHALRLACDPDYRPVHAPARAVATGFRTRSKAGPGSPDIGGARVVRERAPRVITHHDISGQLLIAMKAGRATLGHSAARLGEDIGREPGATIALLRTLQRRELVEAQGGEQGRVNRWRLTPEGQALAEQLADQMEGESAE